MLKNTSHSFGAIAKTFHWFIAFLILGMLAMGFIMTNMSSSPVKYAIYSFHKSTGVMILLLVNLRLMWRLLNPNPKLPSSLHPWHHIMAKLSPLSLYLLMIIMPVSGIILSMSAGYPISLYNLTTLPMILPKDPILSKKAAFIHKYGAFAFIGVLIAHVSAAFYHHFILRTNVLLRMLPDIFNRQRRKGL